MENEAIIGGLKRKRAELFAELRATEKEAVRIKQRIAALDETARLFEPGLDLPTVKRAPGHLGRRTGITRAIMTTLRDAPEPMTNRQIAEAIAPAMNVRTDAPKEVTKLVVRVRSTLARMNGVKSEQRIEGTFWRVAG